MPRRFSEVQDRGIRVAMCKRGPIEVADIQRCLLWQKQAEHRASRLDDAVQTPTYSADVLDRLVLTLRANPTSDAGTASTGRRCRAEMGQGGLDGERASMVGLATPPGVLRMLRRLELRMVTEEQVTPEPQR